MGGREGGREGGRDTEKQGGMEGCMCVMAEGGGCRGGAKAVC